MKERILIAATVSLVLSVTPALAAAKDASTTDATYYKDVLPILQQNCQECPAKSELQTRRRQLRGSPSEGNRS